MPNLCQGRLVWVDLVGEDGRSKRRPVVITASDDEIKTATEFVGIACSHSAASRTPRPADYVQIPHHPAGRCRTKLKKPTIAICRWTVQLRKADLAALPVRYIGGIVEPKHLERIIEAAAIWRERSI